MDRGMSRPMGRGSTRVRSCGLLKKRDRARIDVMTVGMNDRERRGSGIDAPFLWASTRTENHRSPRIVSAREYRGV
jgi:hypothetical protein